MTAYTLPEPSQAAFLAWWKDHCNDTFVRGVDGSAKELWGAAYEAGVEAGIKQCAAKIDFMNDPSRIRLALGEMSAQEMRSVKAALNWVKANCQMLLDDHDCRTVDAIRGEA